MSECSESSWQVYLLKCCDDSLYCGISNDLDKRLKQHCGEIKGGAKYTLSRKPCILVFQEQAKNRSEALKREAEIKKMTRPAKLELVDTKGCL
jgi:putative endonuclease